MENSAEVGQNELGVGQNELPNNRGEVGQNELHKIIKYNIKEKMTFMQKLFGGFCKVIFLIKNIFTFILAYAILDIPITKGG